MIGRLLNIRKPAALFLLLIMLAEIMLPATVSALTSGPSQPEMTGFTPVNATNMVDPFTGDFSYNIPLMDVGGYPLNLAYQSGANMDDEASWVGYGWSLTPGSINRQMRGIPDDFNGTDTMQRIISMKDHKTWGVKGTVSLELLGLPVGGGKTKKNKKKKKKVILPKISFSLAVKNDNYRGIGVDIGANAGLSLGEYVEQKNTSGVQTKDKYDSQGDIASLGFNSSSSDGLSFKGSFNFNTLRDFNGNDPVIAGKSIGFSMNTRNGAAALTLGPSFGPHMKDKEKKQYQLGKNYLGSTGTSFTYAGESVTPTIDIPTKNNSFTLEISGGAEIQIFYVGVGLTGFYSQQYIPQISKHQYSPAYGFLHSEKARDKADEAIMDFNREKDIPFTPEIKTVPIPVPTNDLFSVTGQFGGGQYKTVRNSSGIYFDKKTKTSNNDFTAGVELGFGTYIDVGVNLYYQNITSKSQRWKNQNPFLQNSKGDFSVYTSQNLQNEPAIIKKVGESVPFDQDYYSKTLGKSPVAVVLSQNSKFNPVGPSSEDKFFTKNGTQNIPENIQRIKKEARNNNFNHLTASEASNHALDKQIKSYPSGQLIVSGCSNDSGAIQFINRAGGYRKRHHLSDITIINDDGNRAVYGIPVYNVYQEEVTFSVAQADTSKRRTGIVSYTSQENSTSNNSGRDGYYSKQIMPAYTTSHLLTGILSPDYVDRTSNGITDDDLGTAIKFNYTKMPYEYHWRTPYESTNTATYNEGFLSDTKDDKATYVYGRKELWYMHSIESKTMVAYFVIEDRNDGLGVNASSGGKNSTGRLKRLKEIKLFSKSDLIANNGNVHTTVPIKTVHFVYDYSLGSAFPNSVGNEGKLTLKKVYFTYGRNQKGSLNPYEFSYNKSGLDSNYVHRQYDRWGNYKDAATNPNGLLNSEYPYTLQDTAITNKFVSMWQLSKIILPSGGIIQVNYESDDYAFVQNRRASEMCFVNGIEAPSQSTGLVNSNTLLVSLPKGVSSDQELIERYFEKGGIGEHLYFKLYTDLDNRGHYEFVPGYAIIKSVTRYNGNSHIAAITFEKLGGENPMAKTIWQFLRLHLPKYAYPGSENIDDEVSNLTKAIRALLSALGNIMNVFKNYEKRAKESKYGDKIDLSKSWVRLCQPEFKKLGGGLRVKRIDVSDEWATVSGVAGAKTATYSQLYEYTTSRTVNGQNITISSGVASYEPMIGNDENPFRQPVKYKSKVGIGLNNFLYVEEPYGESFFPAPSVGYSKVTVRSLGSGDAVTVNRIGYIESEFYTAKDFPTLTDQTELKTVQSSKALNKLFGLLGVKTEAHSAISGGYSIEVNDMHGKPRATRIFNKSKELISSEEYFYKCDNQFSEQKQLNNEVDVIKPNGSISKGVIAQDIEMFTDMRESLTENLGTSVRASGGVGAIGFIPIGFGLPNVNGNYSRKIFRSSSTVKIIHRAGILERVKKMENGSTIETENLLWDAVTGNVLLTKVHNEYKDPVFNFTYPAHWAYAGMGPSYLNLGTFMENFSSSATGIIMNATYASILTPGDELISTDSEVKMWVIRSLNNELRVINEAGQFVGVSNIDVRVLRSGRRNMANAAIASIASLKNPIVNNQLSVTQLTKILDAKAVVFSEEWSVPVSSQLKLGDFSQDCIDLDCIRSFFQAAICTNTPPYSNLLAWQNDNKTAGSILQQYANAGGSNIGFQCIPGFYNEQPASGFPYYLHTQRTNQNIVLNNNGNGIHPRYFIAGDTATLGNFKMIFDTVYPNIPPLMFDVLDSGNCVTIHTPNTIPPKTGAGHNSQYYYYFEKNNCSYSLKRGIYPEEGPPNPLLCLPEDSLITVLKFHMANQVDSGYYCSDRIGDTINPYYTGILGNWRPWQSFAYHSDRSNGNAQQPSIGQTDIRNAGFYLNFNSFWGYNTTQQLYLPEGLSISKWISSSYVTFYNTKGQELENRDALNRYSAAQFGYLESVPVAVASNARYREIGYDGFEDYNYSLDCGGADSCNNAGHFSLRKMINGTSVLLEQKNVHTGKFGLKLTGSSSVFINKKITTIDNTDPVYVFSTSGTYLLNRNDLQKGFSPTPNKKYVVSLWVKDQSPRNPSTSLKVKINGTDYVSSTAKWPVVEGWKRIEIPFLLPSTATYFTLELLPGGLTYIDDIRIHPFDAQIKTFTYDPSSMRLMAEMDENNFATFYEYDDEGVLIRVKKETERGIMTIKETRSSYKPR
ncbi:MAG: hypothetical protein HEQ40_12290 [Lacibacter sp.]|jgi:hypothetical protein